MLNWKSFWAKDPSLFGIVMQKSTEYFAKKCLLDNIVKKDSNILDYGCGPGYLGEALNNLPSAYYGVDISKSYIHTCKSKFKTQSRFHFFTLDENADASTLEDLAIPKKFFDTIIILSVVQYLETKEKVNALLQSLLPFLNHTGEIILADVIDSDKNFLKDLYNICMYSIGNGYFFKFIQFVFQLKFSSYNKMRITNRLLTLSQSDVEEICSSLKLQYRIVENCTLHSSRKNYVIYF